MQASSERDSEALHPAPNIPRKPVSLAQTRETAILEKEHDTIATPPGWPKGPRSPERTIGLQLWDITIDVLYGGLSVAFLVFGLLVLRYNQAHVKDHQDLASSLKDVTTYVGLSHRLNMILALSADH